MQVRLFLMAAAAASAPTSLALRGYSPLLETHSKTAPLQSQHHQDQRNQILSHATTLDGAWAGNFWLDPLVLPGNDPLPRSGVGTWAQAGVLSPLVAVVQGGHQQQMRPQQPVQLSQLRRGTGSSTNRRMRTKEIVREMGGGWEPTFLHKNDFVLNDRD